MLDGYHQRLAELRDQAAIERTHRPVRDLKKLRSLARTRLFDVAAAAREIEDFVDNDDSYRYGTMEMRYVRKIKGEHGDLLQGLRESQRTRARQVAREATLLQSVLKIRSEISQTIGNIRLQRLAVFLTVLSIGIAVLALMLSVRAEP